MNSRDPGMNAVAVPGEIADVQSSVDTRHLPIDSVGIRSVKYPVLLEMKGQAPVPSVAEFEMTVYLPETQKGTHMSRFIALLEDLQGKPLNVEGFRGLLADMTGKLEAPAGRIKMKLPYFLSKAAPVSGVSSLLDYELEFDGTISQDGTTETWLTVVVPVTSLCPCSKNISDYGAHNQRSHVTARVLLKGDVDIAVLVSTIEKQASCELYGLLKRPDEKYVTERAYDNPKFVEDLVRDVSLALEKIDSIGGFEIEAENFESIHNHSAYARIQRF